MILIYRFESNKEKEKKNRQVKSNKEKDKKINYKKAKKLNLIKGMKEDRLANISSEDLSIKRMICRPSYSDKA